MLLHYIYSPITGCIPKANYCGSIIYKMIATGSGYSADGLSILCQYVASIYL